MLKNNKYKLRRRLKKLFFLSLFLISLDKTYNYLDKSSIEIDNKDIVDLVLNKYRIKKKYKSITKMIDSVKFIQNNYNGLVDYKDDKSHHEKVVKVSNSKANAPPLIYLYNSHQTEEYSKSTVEEFTLNPTVMMADYIIESVFSKNNLKTIVEKKSIKDILNREGLSYNASYKASRILMEEAKRNNPSLKYFIDIHRDSLERNRTTVEINNKSYAKVLFLIGLENESYEENLAFTEKINNKLNSKYPNLSKGILKKGGRGVNGVYNQDFSKYTILIEIGGFENTIDEVLNSSLAISDILMEVISEVEN